MPGHLFRRQFDQCQFCQPYPHATESKGVLSCYGIPVTTVDLARTAEEAVLKAEKLGYPLAMKIHSRDISHKSDVGGVILDIKDPQGIRNSFNKMMDHVSSALPRARILGVSLQPMVSESTCELVLGIKNDPNFGPVLLFGMGGVMTEVVNDKVLALPPLNRLLAGRVIEETKISRILKGYRGREPVNMALLEEILIRMSYLASDFPEIQELDINPLMVSGSKILAADARIMLQSRTTPVPLHLVISPYPNQFEEHTRTKAGEAVFIRPIRPEDAPVLVDFFKGLSPRTIYYRFFSPLKHLSPVMLALGKKTGFTVRSPKTRDVMN